MRIDDFYNYLKAFHGITLYATRHLNDMKLLKSHSILTRFHTFLYTFVKYIMEPTPSLCFTGLHTHGYDDCQPFSLKGKTLQARLVNVHDGDTHTYIIELYPGDFYRFTVRLAGIDTPELKNINPCWLLKLHWHVLESPIHYMDVTHQQQNRSLALKSARC